MPRPSAVQCMPRPSAATDTPPNEGALDNHPFPDHLQCMPCNVCRAHLLVPCPPAMHAAPTCWFGLLLGLQCVPRPSAGSGCNARRAHLLVPAASRAAMCAVRICWFGLLLGCSVCRAQHLQCMPRPSAGSAPTCNVCRVGYAMCAMCAAPTCWFRLLLGRRTCGKHQLFVAGYTSHTRRGEARCGRETLPRRREGRRT